MKSKPPILLYHSISAANLALAVDRRSFDQQVAYLRRAGYTGTSFVDAIARGAVVSDQRIVLTFDDGFGDFYDAAVGMLAHSDFRATVYVVSGFVDRKSTPWHHLPLAWSQIRELAELGFEIGAHTRTHPDLRRLSSLECWDEIHGSKQDIEDKLGSPVRTFAYPFGYLNSGVVKIVKEAGYVGACAVKLNRDIAETPWTAQRTTVTRKDEMWRFRLKLSRPHQRLLEARIAGHLGRWVSW